MNTDGLQCPQCYSFGPFDDGGITSPVKLECGTCGHVATVAEFKECQEAK